MNAIKRVLTNPMLWVAVIYLVLPVDFVPDAVPAVGTIDDLIPFIISLLIQEVTSSNRQ